MSQPVFARLLNNNVRYEEGIFEECRDAFENKEGVIAFALSVGAYTLDEVVDLFVPLIHPNLTKLSFAGTGSGGFALTMWKMKAFTIRSLDEIKFVPILQKTVRMVLTKRNHLRELTLSHLNLSKSQESKLGVVVDAATALEKLVLAQLASSNLTTLFKGASKLKMLEWCMGRKQNQEEITRLYLSFKDAKPSNGFIRITGIAGDIVDLSLTRQMLALNCNSCVSFQGPLLRKFKEDHLKGFAL